MKVLSSPFLLLFVFLCIVACELNQTDVPALVITDVNPGRTWMGGSRLGTAMPGDTLTLSGENFSAIPVENRVLIGNLPAPVINASATLLRVRVPDNVALGFSDLMVSRPGFRSAQTSISVSNVPSPEITGISPASGPVGTRLIIYGKNLDATLAANVVAFTGANGELVFIRPFTPLRASADSIQLEIPAGARTGPIHLWACPDATVDNNFFSVISPVFTVNE